MRIGTTKYARIKVEGTMEMVMVPVSTDKPSIPENMQQRINNHFALLIGFIQLQDIERETAPPSGFPFNSRTVGLTKPFSSFIFFSGLR